MRAVLSRRPPASSRARLSTLGRGQTRRASMPGSRMDVRTVLTVFVAACGRKGIGIELKASYYSQAVRNLEAAEQGWRDSAAQDTLFAEA